MNNNVESLAEIATRSLNNYLGEYLIIGNESNYDLNKLAYILKSGKYTTRFRLFVLYPDERINYEIPQQDIINNSGNYNENYQNGQRRNVNLNIINIDGKYTPSINTIWAANKFRLDIGVEVDGGIFWFPRGIYIMGNPTSKHENSDKQLSLSLIDKFGLLEGKMGTLETTYEIPEGSDIEEAIKGILTIDNGSGYCLDLKPIIYDHSFKGKRTPYTVRKDPGSTFGEMILELADILGAECFYNDVGNLCFIPINETIQDKDKPIIWDLGDKEREFIGTSTNYDFENIVNAVYIVGDNVNNKICAAMAENNDPESPICIQRIGRRIKYVNDTAIYSDQLAQDRATYELRKEKIMGTTVSVNATFNPLLFVDNIITIEDDFYKYKREKFLIQSISYGIGDSNEMKITCSNVHDRTMMDNETEDILSRTMIIHTPYGNFDIVIWE